MQNKDFCHLHLHTTHSAFDGFNNIQKVVRKAKECGHTAIGITDHGTVSGIIQFIKACRKEEIRPVIGMEAYLARNMHEKNPDGRKGNRHINVFAKNMEGYRNLCRMSQAASLEGFYHSGRIDIDLLAKHSEGIIVSTACLSNIVNWNLKIGRYDKAKKAATIFKDIFKDDFYLEIMYHGMEDEAKIIPLVQKLAKELNVKIIASNDSHYCDKEDAAVHDVVLCLGQRGTCIRNPKRLKFPGKEFYYKTTEEMYKIFKYIPSSMKNTIELAEKCDLSELKFGGMNLPKYQVPEGFTDTFEYLKYLAWNGLKAKGLDTKSEYVDRLNLELSDVQLVIEQNLRFDVYFLTVLEIINFIREKQIPYGIRGSGNGSLLLYCLNISRVDPLKYCGGLFWTRFLGFDWVPKIDSSDFGICPLK